MNGACVMQGWGRIPEGTFFGWIHLYFLGNGLKELVRVEFFFFFYAFDPTHSQERESFCRKFEKTVSMRVDGQKKSIFCLTWFFYFLGFLFLYFRRFFRW